jgi:hypothetical protein
LIVFSTLYQKRL